MPAYCVIDPVHAGAANHNLPSGMLKGRVADQKGDTAVGNTVQRPACYAGESSEEQPVPSVQSMHTLHHGREIHCVQLLQAPAPHQAAAVITGGEDSTLRSFLFHDGGVAGMV